VPLTHTRRRFFAPIGALVVLTVACVSSRDSETKNVSTSSLLARVDSIVRDDARLRALPSFRSNGMQVDAKHGLVSEGWRIAEATGFSDLAVRIPERADADIEIGVATAKALIDERTVVVRLSVLCETATVVRSGAFGHGKIAMGGPTLALVRTS